VLTSGPLLGRRRHQACDFYLGTSPASNSTAEVPINSVRLCVWLPSTSIGGDHSLLASISDFEQSRSSSGVLCGSTIAGPTWGARAEVLLADSVSAEESDLFLDLRRRNKKNQTRAAITAKPAIPPTTPPTIAPVEGWLSGTVGSGKLGSGLSAPVFLSVLTLNNYAIQGET